jgi:hypothetical protein
MSDILSEIESVLKPLIAKWRGTYVLNHVAVVADEEDGSAIGQVDLHADQTVGVARQVVQGDALAEIEAAFVKGLPVPVLKVRFCVSERCFQCKSQKCKSTYRPNLR